MVGYFHNIHVMILPVGMSWQANHYFRFGGSYPCKIGNYLSLLVTDIAPFCTWKPASMKEDFRWTVVLIFFSIFCDIGKWLGKYNYNPFTVGFSDPGNGFSFKKK